MFEFRKDPSRPGQLKSKSGGACISFIGIVAVGVGMFAACIDMVFPNSGAEPAAKIIASGFLLGVGSLFLFLRSPTIIDRKRGAILDEITFGFIPLRSKQTPLDTFSEVEIRKETRRSDKSSYTVYPVALKGGQTREFGSSQTYEEARKLAETVAECVQLPLIDYSSGKPVRREHDMLNESLADQLRRLGTVVDIPEAPPIDGLSAKISGSELVMDIPKGSLNIIAILMLVMLPVIVGSMVFPMAFSFIRDGKAIPPIFLVVIAVFFLAPICIVLSMAWKTVPAAQTLIVNPRTCTIIEKRPLFSTKTELKTDEIEEMVNMESSTVEQGNPMAVILPNRGLVLRTDNGSIEFAKGLSEDAREFIESTIKVFLIENC